MWIVGEVENIGDVATKSTKVTAIFYNLSNNVIAVEDGHTSLNILLPGRKTSFAVMLNEMAGSFNVQNYTLSVSWKNYVPGKTLGLEILSTNEYVDEYGNFHVIGEIENQGTTEARFVRAFVTFYDSQGAVIGIDWDLTEPLDLVPLSKGKFDLELIYEQQVTKIATWELSAESMEYGLIPEFPSYTIILAAWILVGFVGILTRNLKKMYSL